MPNSTHFLDSAGLAYLWTKTKNYVQSQSGGASKFTITVTENWDNNEVTYTMDKTYAQVLSAYNNGDILEVVMYDACYRLELVYEDGENDPDFGFATVYVYQSYGDDDHSSVGRFEITIHADGTVTTDDTEIEIGDSGSSISVDDTLSVQGAAAESYKTGIKLERVYTLALGDGTLVDGSSYTGSFPPIALTFMPTGAELSSAVLYRVDGYTYESVRSNERLVYDDDAHSTCWNYYQGNTLIETVTDFDVWGSEILPHLFIFVPTTPSVTESDPVFTASPAYGITASDITNWNGKTNNVGTITGVSVNGTSVATSGVADITVPSEIFIGSTTPSGYTVWIDPDNSITNGNEVEY